jgi:acyl-CoA thioester hydrolase
VQGAVSIRVIYADTDAMGVVYHMNYIRWFEIGRTELMRDMGVVYAELEKQDYRLPVTELHCHYNLPARYDQIVRVETRVTYMRRASIKFEYEIWDEAREKLLVDGYSVHAFINGQGKIVRPPEDVAAKIKQGLAGG